MINLPENIDKNSYEPAYIQIANFIRQQIAKGIFRPGGRLPSESELRKNFNVSPMTVRRSINLLLDQGVVDTIQGSGTFVRPIGLDRVTFHLDEFHDIFKETENTKVKLLEVGIERADHSISEKLHINNEDRIILLRRLLIKDLEPMVYHEEYLIYDPLKPIVEAEMEVTSLHGLFHNTSKSDLKRGELSIEATTLPEYIALLLSVPENSPAFRLEHIFYDFNNKRISWGNFFCRGDRFRFRTEIGFATDI